MLAGREGMRLYWERYPRAGAHGRGRARVFTVGDGGFQLPLCGLALLYRERYPAAPDDIHAAGVDDIPVFDRNDIREPGLADGVVNRA